MRALPYAKEVESPSTLGPNALSSAQENAILRFGGEGSQPLRAQFRQAPLERLAPSPRFADAGKLPLRFRKFDRSISADHVPIGPLRTTFARFARSRSTSSAHSNILCATQTPISRCPIAVSRFRSTRKPRSPGGRGLQSSIGRRSEERRVGRVYI